MHCPAAITGFRAGEILKQVQDDKMYLNFSQFLLEKYMPTHLRTAMTGISRR